MNEIIKTLVKKGFVKGHRKILSDAEIEELKNFLVKHREEFNKHNNSKNDPGRLGKRSMMFCDIVGKNKRIDEILNKIISNEEVQITLQKVLGDNFLLTNPIARFNHPEDKGLGIHQDAPGEAGLLFLVNDQPDGSTIMLPGSHLIYGRIGGLVSWCSLRLLKITRFFFSSIKGNAGDYFFWFYKTWHGRLPGSNDTKISIFFDCFPVASKRIDEAKENESTNENFKNITQPNLKKMMSIELYENNVSKLNEEISKNINNKSLPLSLEIESVSKIFFNLRYFTFACIKIIILELIFFPIYFLRLAKYIKRIFA